MLVRTGGRFLLLSCALGQRKQKGDPLMDLLLMLGSSVFKLAASHAQERAIQALVKEREIRYPTLQTRHKCSDTGMPRKSNHESACKALRGRRAKRAGGFPFGIETPRRPGD